MIAAALTTPTTSAAAKPTENGFHPRPFNFAKPVPNPTAPSAVAVGRNVGECFIRLYYLERACQAQIMALSAGDQVNNPPQGSPEITAQQGAIGLPLAANLLAWPALKRKAYRLDPGFAT